jgi:hypothetical protein
MSKTLPVIRAGGRPTKTAVERASEIDQLRDAANAYRATKPPPDTAPTPPTKPKRRLATANYPTEIKGWPLNPSPPASVPDYGTMSRVQAIKHRQRKVGAQLPSKFGEPQLIKRSDLRTWRTAE